MVQLREIQLGENAFVGGRGYQLNLLSFIIISRNRYLGSPDAISVISLIRIRQESAG